MITANESNDKTRENLIKRSEEHISPFLTDLERKIAIACDNCEYGIKDIFKGYNITQKEISDIINTLNIKGYRVTNRKTINVSTDEWIESFDLSWEYPRESKY